MEKYRILAVDDDKDILELLSYNLIKEGYEVKTLTKSLNVLREAKKFDPHLILLDIMMPEIDGVTLCRQLRKDPAFKETFIIFLTARGEEYSEVAGFESGANDYIVKPIRPRALLSRINSTLKRKVRKGSLPEVMKKDGLEIDKLSYTVKLHGEIIEFPKKEFELLYFLANNSNQVFNRDVLLSRIWGDDVQVLSRTVDVHIRKIREKIGNDYIKTIKGVGYKFES